MLTISINNKKIRLLFLWGLIFSFLLTGCSENKKEVRNVAIKWEGRRASGIVIPWELLPGIPKDSVGKLLHIQLVNSQTPILGEYILTDSAVIFRPLIAFTRGLKYQLLVSNKLISAIEIPVDDTYAAPAVISIYPTNDVVPLNLLKIYIEFSKPMQEGQAMKNIAVIKNLQDTIPSIFLDLEQELWNKERTMLTLWLDPGRIKRDLQPNKTMGSPLEQGASYQIVIRKDWPDAEGVALTDTYRKDFVVGLRDSLSPDPVRWAIYPPIAGSRQSLKIALHEPLDFVLLKNAVRIIDAKGNIVNGIFGTEAEETILNFAPSVDWNPGDYTLEIESRLEDLAGNNLNRLFDKDLTRQNKGGQKEVYKRSFHVQ